MVISRLSGRRVCKKCGATYHIKNIPPKKTDICDVCGSPLIQREDDKEATVKNRLAVYKKETAELIDYYRNKNILKTISGDLEVNDSFKAVVKLFKNDSIKV
jgi:adenylate kinase